VFSNRIVTDEEKRWIATAAKWQYQ
jgi:hypothetical protein